MFVFRCHGELVYEIAVAMLEICFDLYRYGIYPKSCTT